MARTEIPVQVLDWDDEPFPTEKTYQAFNCSTTSDFYVEESYLGEGGKLIFRAVISDSSTDDTLTVKAGDGMRSGMGDIEWKSLTGAAENVVIGPLDTSRFKVQNSSAEKGHILVDVAGSRLAGTIVAYKLPR